MLWITLWLLSRIWLNPFLWASAMSRVWTSPRLICKMLWKILLDPLRCEELEVATVPESNGAIPWRRSDCFWSSILPRLPSCLCKEKGWTSSANRTCSGTIYLCDYESAWRSAFQWEKDWIFGMSFRRKHWDHLWSFSGCAQCSCPYKWL